MLINVKWQGQDNRTLDVPDGTTVGQALNILGCPGSSVRIGDRLVQAHETVRDGDCLSLGVVNGKAA